MDSKKISAFLHLGWQKSIPELKNIFFTDNQFIQNINNIIVDPSINSEEKFSIMKSLSALVMIQLRRRHNNEPTDFDPTPLQEAFRNYFYEHTMFSDKIIPFEEWSDIAEEVMLILQSLLNEKKMTQYLFDSHYEAMGDKFNQRLHELADKGYTNLLELSGR